MLSIPEEDVIVEMMKVYASMEKEVLISLVAGTLPRDKLHTPAVKRTVNDALELSNSRPSVYNIAIVDVHTMCPPSPAVLRKVIQLALLYCRTDRLEELTGEYRKTIFEMDQVMQVTWSLDDLKTKYLRSFLCSCFSTPADGLNPSS